MIFSRHTLLVLPLAALVSGCGSSNDNPLISGSEYQYRVTITNLTTGQPFSPAAVVIHHSGWQALELEQPATVGLEKLAEGGDNSDFISAADADSDVLSTATGQGMIAPGATEELTVSVGLVDDHDLSLSWVSMPVNTNDGLAGVIDARLSGWDVGQSETFLAISYDAGTEANTESADTVPGPAASGLAEGFNPVRDDVRNAVYLHAGVVTGDDGLTTSTLGEMQRWDNPIASVRVERLQ